MAVEANDTRNQHFLTRVELSVRTYNCLKNEGIRFVGEFAQKGEAELLRLPNFGRKSLNELKEILAQIGLHLGVAIFEWPQPDPELLSRQANKLLERIDELELSVRSANCLKNDRNNTWANWCRSPRQKC